MTTKEIISLFVLTIFLSIAAGDHDDSSPDYVKVYKHDGSIQRESSGIGLEEMKLELTSAGMDVICAQKGHDGLARSAVCGAGTGSLNIYTIYRVNLPDEESLGFHSVSELTEYKDEKCEL